MLSKAQHLLQQGSGDVSHAAPVYRRRRR
jgi:hypothetical protein